MSLPLGGMDTPDDKWDNNN